MRSGTAGALIASIAGVVTSSAGVSWCPCPRGFFLSLSAGFVCSASVCVKCKSVRGLHSAVEFLIVAVQSTGVTALLLFAVLCPATPVSSARHCKVLVQAIWHAGTVHDLWLSHHVTWTGGCLVRSYGDLFS
jgi:hypothetical protein